jgi:hypothetical protein
MYAIIVFEEPHHSYAVRLQKAYIYIYTYIYIYIYIYVRVYVYIYTYMHTYIAKYHTYMNACTQMVFILSVVSHLVYLHTHAYTCICIHECMYVCGFTHTMSVSSWCSRPAEADCQRAYITKPRNP